MTDFLCPQCKVPNRNSARFCSNCGAPLLMGVSEAQPVQSDTVPLVSGTVLQGRYRIENLLGKGGFGAVYRTWDLSLSRVCALKENLDTSSEAQRQFAREATVLASLSHTNLPRVTDHFLIAGQGQYLVMDYVEGDDLVSIVGRQGIPPVEQAMEWLYQVMDALVYLHGRQPPVIHRDIKPANIRITPEGRAMLVDFGLVKTTDAHTKTTLGARAVTPGYSPPEQYGQGSTDSRTDIYAFGATLYALLTGQDPPESVLRIAQDFLPPADQLNPKVSPAIAEVVARAMSLNPSQRFQNMATFKTELKAAAMILPPLMPSPALVDPTVIISAPSSAVGDQSAAKSQSTATRASGAPEWYAPPNSAPAAQYNRESPAAPFAGTARPPAAAGKRKLAGWLAGLLVFGVILAVLVLLALWGMLSQSSDDAMQQTIDAGVAATRTAAAEATQVNWLPEQSGSNAGSLPVLEGTGSDGPVYLTPTPGP